jgi:hypothetical protein
MAGYINPRWADSLGAREDTLAAPLLRTSRLDWSTAGPRGFPTVCGSRIRIHRDAFSTGLWVRPEDVSHGTLGAEARDFRCSFS